MLRTKSFRKGGVHPPDKKSITEGMQIKPGILPQIAKIPVIQHLGAPAEIVVKKDDIVEEGQLIAKAKGQFSANIHASIPGKVIGIESGYIPTGIKCDMILIEFDGEFKQSQYEQIEWTNLSNQEILDKILDAGIVGMGGATFPTHIKVTPGEDKKIEYLLVNGAECEPYLTADHQLMNEKATEIITGAQIVKKLIGCNKVIICIENNKKDAIKLMDSLLHNIADFDVAPMKTRYPQGGEKQLIKAVLGKEVPSGKLPLDIGCVVSNVGTLFSIYEAVALNKPLIERIVTITGSIVRKPGNFKVKIGTMVKDLVEDAEYTEEPEKIIIGGPMMGFTQNSLDVPITKGANGIILLSKKESEVRRNFNCIKCGRCISSCPMGLNPSELSILVEHNEFEKSQKLGIFDCIECGACTYACPAERHLTQYCRYGKLMIKKNIKYSSGAIPEIPVK